MSEVTDIMKEILEKMNAYWSSHTLTEEEDGKNYFIQEDDESSELYDLLFVNLTPNGEWNITFKNYLQENGYRCYIGDGDSFGILVACIRKDNKIFTVG